jgi:RimJ/RimL family protein N-acetyltransferase
MLRVWGRISSSNVQKVMWAIGELGLAHERIDAGREYGGLDTPEYGALNPNRRIPTLRDGDVVLWESNVIVGYLSARYGAGRLWPLDPAARGIADQWMAAPRELRTDRLRLRRWRAADGAPFAALNADPRVTAYLPGALSREESDALVARIEAHFDRYGFGLWAVEIRDGASFAGFLGLSVPCLEAHFTPCVEIGWRLAAEHWGRGYATEGARAVLALGFDVLGLEQIVSFTVPGNARSRRVMERIGMTCMPADDFDHPLLPDGHAFRRHVLYRIARPAATRRPMAGTR